MTRLGALAFATLALTPTSTSVPAHTIAWLYDSTCNETIVYVNPTDQTLSIGNSGLLEIHLQGIATVEASDFDFVAAGVATAAASGEPLNLELAATAETEGAVIATSTADGPSEAIVDDADATVQTSDVGFSLNADRDPLVSGHARIVSFGEDLSKPTEETEISAVITPENGQPVVPHHLHISWPAESKFAFDSAPALNSASAMPAHDVMMHPSVAIQLAAIATPHAAGDIAELQVNVHKHEPEGGGGNTPTHSHGNNGSRANSTVALGDGDLEVPEVSGNHGQVVASLVANAWEPPAHANNHSTEDDTSEHGADPSHGANIHGTSGSRAAVKPGLGDSFQFNHAIAGSEREGENAPSHSHGKNASIPSDADEQGAAQLHGAPSSDPHGMASSADVGKHVLGDSFHFNHAIAGSESSGIVELASLDLAPASTGRHANAAENSQPGESQTIELSLPGNAVDHFQGHPGNTHAHHELMV